MPPAKKKTPALRCAYVEGGRKCGRSATGNPPLCEAHREALSVEANRPPRVGEKFVGMLNRAFQGKKVSDAALYTGIEDLVDVFTTPGARQQAFMDAARARIAAEPRAQRLAEAMRESARKVAHAQAERAAGRPPSPAPPSAVMLARQELGFAPREVITREILKTRCRELALRYHPDKPTGSELKMAAVNHARDVLEAEIEKAA